MKQGLTMFYSYRLYETRLAKAQEEIWVDTFNFFLE